MKKTRTQDGIKNPRSWEKAQLMATLLGAGTGCVNRSSLCMNVCFQALGPIEAKDLVWAMVVLARGMKRSWRWEERIRRREEAEIGGRI